MDKNSKITIKPQLLRSISARSALGEGSSLAKEELKVDDIMSRMSFESIRDSVD